MTELDKAGQPVEQAPETTTTMGIKTKGKGLCLPNHAAIRGN